MSNHFYYDYPFIMSNLTKSEYSFIMGSLLLRVTSFIMGPSLLCVLHNLQLLTFSRAVDHHPQEEQQELSHSNLGCRHHNEQ